MLVVWCFCLALVGFIAQCDGAATTCTPRLRYPDARRDESVVDDYFGIKVADPYRWLEDPDSEETKEFVEAQNKITGPYLEASPIKKKVQARLTALWNYPKYGIPMKRGSRYFFLKNNGLQNQPVLYVQNSLKDEPRVFFDANTLSADGTVALNSYKFSEDGKTFAYGLSKSGSDWLSIHFRDVETGKDYPDILSNVKFTSMSWTKDGRGFFYSRYPEQGVAPDGSQTNSNINHKHYFHKLSTPQSEDILVLDFPEEPFWRIGSQVSDDGRYLFVTTTVTDFNRLYYVDLQSQGQIKGKLNLVTLVDNFEATYDYLTNDGTEVLLRTNKNAPRFKLIKINLNNPTEDQWEDFIPEHEHDTMDWAVPVAKDKLVIHYLRDVTSVLQLHSLKDGSYIQTFELPPLGTITGFFGDKDENEIFYNFVSFLDPGTSFHVDFTERPYKPTVFRKIEIKGFDASAFEPKQIFYTSKDGTRIPMFIITRKNVQRNGKNPTLLYGYGGFNINLQPSFNIFQLVFLQHFNGIVAIPNIRGGGEYGEKWHEAGTNLNKQNVFDDFQAAAEYLIAAKYTQPSLLTIQGGSNGGLLVGACITQRPDLFGAAIIQVGVLDMLRYHKFTIGHAWASDYGTSDNQTEFLNLIKYSPLHNLRTPTDVRNEYPATLVLTADHDDRVVPLHSLKFIATLQHAVQDSPQRSPVLARIDTKAGHGGGKPTAKVIEEYSDILSFMAQTLGLSYKN